MIEPRFYTGVGSRAAPQSAITRAEGFAYSLAAKGFRGRSGKAPGMDQAFMAGASRFCRLNDAECLFTNYIPNSNFQSGIGCPVGVEDIVAPALGNWIEAVRIARDVYGSGWAYISQGDRDLHTRNVYQVLGTDLNTKSEFVLFAAPRDGPKKVKGGTNTAFQVAKLFGVPTYNLLSFLEWQKFMKELK
ncbi:MAG: hypothetical protein ACRCTP_03835 [Aeromonas popoffii]|uniref:hypothetical protein n=1 Tax=Aeromonas popoffii TaxID=70856 RepID=UPI003F322907